MKKNQAAVSKELEAMDDFAVVIDSECSQTEQEALDEQQMTDESLNNFNVSELVSSLQEMKVEEEKLIEIKRQKLTQRNDLQIKLNNEIGKKKTRIANLKSEILGLQNEIRQLEQALGLEIFTETQANRPNPPLLVETKELQAPPVCIGLLKCAKPEKCGDYESCVKKYMTAEIRNDTLKL